MADVNTQIIYFANCFSAELLAKFDFSGCIGMAAALIIVDKDY